MDTSEKVLVFRSFDTLTQEIIKDSSSTDMLAQRYSVRFIMLNNFTEFQSLAKFMVNIGVDSLDLETLIDDEDKDTWITASYSFLSSVKYSVYSYSLIALVFGKVPFLST